MAWLTRSTLSAAATLVAVTAVTSGPGWGQEQAAHSGDEVALQAIRLQAEIDRQLQLSPGGTQISHNQIAWRDGHVVMTFLTDSKSIFGPRCPSGQFCVFEDRDWGGRRMLQFSDCNPSGRFVDLAWYGFNDETSSWHNRSAALVDVYNWAGFEQFLWRSEPGARSSWVGSVNNDRADHLFLYCQ